MFLLKFHEIPTKTNMTHGKLPCPTVAHRALPLSPLAQRRRSRHMPCAGRGAGGEVDRATSLGETYGGEDVFWGFTVNHGGVNQGIGY